MEIQEAINRGVLEAIEQANKKVKDLNCSCREDHGQLAQCLKELEARRKVAKEMVAVLQPLSPSLGIVRAILEDNGFEQVSLKVSGIQSRIDFVIAKLKEIKTEE